MNNKVYVLRNCREDMTSHNGFVWPKKGHVKCPDWEPTKNCGNGLHGFLWGVGDVNLLYPQKDCYWLVVEVDKDEIIDLDNKVKFPEGNVVCCVKKRIRAIKKLISLGANPDTIMFGSSVSGDYETSISGDYGTSISGYNGTSISKDYGTSTSDNCGTSISGYNGTSTSDDYGTSTSGYNGTSTSGYNGISTSKGYGTSTSGECGISTSKGYGTSTSGYDGTSISGDYGTSTSGYDGTSISGECGTSTSGYNGTSISKDYGTSISGECGISISGYNGLVKTSNGGVLFIHWIENKERCYIVGSVGVGKEYKPNTFYRRVGNKLVEV